MGPKSSKRAAQPLGRGREPGGRGPAWGPGAVTQRGCRTPRAAGAAGSERSRRPLRSARRARVRLALPPPLRPEASPLGRRLPTHPDLGAPAAAGGGEGEEDGRCGVREGKEEGGRGRLRRSWPAAQRRATCHHGHCHEPPCHAHAGGRGGALGVTWEGRACRTWTWTPPGPLHNSRPHSRRPVAWPGQSLTRGNLGRPKSKSARFIQESSAERFLRVGGGSRGVSQESNNRSSYCGSLRRCAVSTPGLAHTCPFLAYVWSH